MSFLLSPVVKMYVGARIEQRPVLHLPASAGHRSPFGLSRAAIIANPTVGAGLMRHSKGLKLSANRNCWMVSARHPMTGTQHG